MSHEDEEIEPLLANYNVTESPIKTTPLPRLQMMMIMIVTFVEPVQFGVIFPFVYFMVRDFNVSDDPKKIGYYVGLLTSSFCIAQLFSSFPWGRISDKYGRRPIIIMGLVGNALTCALFGSSKTLIFAISIRSLCGLLNGNVGVIKSMLGEMTDSTNRGLAFSYWQAAFGMGTIVGPVLGGFLVNPVDQFPWLFGSSILFREYPYLLPCLVSSVISMCGALLGYFYMEETLQRKRESSITTLEGNLADSNLDSYEGGLPLSKIMSKQVCISILCYATWCLITILYEETYALFVAEPLTSGGLQFSSFEIGLALSLTGFAQLFGQLVIYPILEPRLDKRQMFRLASISIAVFSLCLPLCSDFAKSVVKGEYYTNEQKLIVFAVLQFLLVGKTISSVLGYIPVMIMVNDSAPNEESLGTVHGFGQVAAALARSIGPAAGGYFWAWSIGNNLSFPFDFHFTFIVISSLAIVSFFETYLF